MAPTRAVGFGFSPSTARRCVVPAPMPRFEADPVVITAWIRQAETTPARVCFQPSISRGVGEVFVELDVVRGTKIDRAPCMVFAEARGSDETQDVVQLPSGVELFADDFGLPRDGAKA